MDVDVDEAMKSLTRAKVSATIWPGNGVIYSRLELRTKSHV